jgi:hypothetical protein
MIRGIIDLSVLVPTLCHMLRSPHLVLRQSAVACLRQLAQREAREVCVHAAVMIEAEKDKEGRGCLDVLRFTESGLPGILFSILDHELDHSLISNIHDTLTSIMQSMAAENLTGWLGLLREVLTVSATDTDEANGGGGGLGGGGGKDGDAEDDDDDAADKAGDDENFTSGEEMRDSIQPRWPTRVFGAECLRRIIEGEKHLVFSQQVKMHITEIKRSSPHVFFLPQTLQTQTNV